ncbi:MAG: RluA family pseudouridine synthase [Solobacterium sp.]|nr:RluA family pseudouridine synthase [Solobacterium sp.]
MDKEFTITLTQEEYDETSRGQVGKILSKVFGFSRKEISRLKFQGEILYEGKKVHVNEHIPVSGTLTAVFHEPDTEQKPETDFIPDIIYEDDDMVIVNKPSGMPVHAGHGHLDDSLGDALAGWYASKGETFTVRVIGRLDSDVSGLVIYAKNQPAAARLSSQRAEGILRKTYTALASGHFAEKEGVIDLPVAKTDGSVKRTVSEDGKEAQTSYKVIREFMVNGAPVSLLELVLKTGRTHQIRAHLSALSHPLLGDQLYSGDCTLIERPALHCSAVECVSPFTNAEIKAEGAIPADMEAVIEAAEAQQNTEPETTQKKDIPEEVMPEAKQKRSFTGYIPWLLAAGICVWGGMRISETLPPTAAGLREIFAETKKANAGEITVEYGSDPDLLSYLTMPYGTASLIKGVNTDLPGHTYAQYELSATSVGNQQVTDTGLLKVLVTDTQAPVIELAQEYVTIPMKEEYSIVDNIVIVSDPVDGELSQAETLEKNSYTVESDVNTARAGVYQVTVHAMDKNGLTSSVSWPVTVERWTLADQQNDTADLARIALSSNHVMLEVGDPFEISDVLLAVTDRNGIPLKQSEELQPLTYMIKGDVTTEEAGINSLMISAMNENGDITMASATVQVGSDEEVMKASGVMPGSPYGQIYLFLTSDMGLNRAAACGILANMARESGFNPTADNSGLYHGLCQWGGGRLSNLYSWCWQNGYDPETIEGQVHFLELELNGSYRGVLEQLRAIENTADGAYHAAAVFEMQFEGSPGLHEGTCAQAAAYFQQ